MMSLLGSPVYAISDGVVTRRSTSGWCSDNDLICGNVVLGIRHNLPDGTQFVALYGHIQTTLTENDSVVGGAPIGTVGPWSNGTHLHFGVHPGTTLPADNLGLLPNSN